MTHLHRTLAARGLLSFALGVAAASAPAETRDDILAIVEATSLGERTHLLPEPVEAREAIHHFYHQRDYEPAWSGRAQVDEIVGILGASAEHGLNPDDYHHGMLLRLADAWDTMVDARDAVRARFDVLLSDGVLLYARDLRFGKVDPARFEETWNYPPADLDVQRLSSGLAAAIERGEVAETLRSFEPGLRFYGLLKNELARYRALDARYDFTPVPDDTVLRPGASHANVPLLREQLRRLGLIDATQPADSERLDQELEAAVRRFQTLHGLSADGVVGRDSFAALNTSYAERVDQMRVNLDRVRWVRGEVLQDQVLVNIAGYEMYYFRGGELNWQSDVMVGTINHQTPLFRAEMKYLVLNPTWTVPWSIIRRSLFARMKADPGYAAQRNFKLYDTDGNEVDPQQLDWDSYSPGRFPFRVVQQPGPSNALGRVKFIFPNAHAIYLHDTPSRDLFQQTTRAFSHGCIRVRDPLDFAERLLADQPDWSRASIDRTLEEGDQTRVNLSQPLEVMLMYWTASPDGDGGIQLHPDIYERDSRVLAALEEAPSWAGG